MHHHHGVASTNHLVGGFFLAMLALATVLHLRARLARDPCDGGGRAWGHVLMAGGMGYMLLVQRRTIPFVGWQVVFCLSGIYFLVAAIRAWRAQDRVETLWHGDLAVGDAAMVHMLRPAGLAWTPFSVLLGTYFALRAALAGGVLLWRGVTFPARKRQGEHAFHHRLRLALARCSRG